MLNTIFATKIGMSQAWTTLGKRLPITKLWVDDNCILSVKQDQNKVYKAEVAYGKKKLKNVSKSIRTQLSKSGFSSGFRQIKGVEADETIKPGKTITLDQVLAVGDVVAVQGTSKGRGFAGSIKRHNFKSGPRTHGQSDRERAPGSIGAGTDPGRVWRGKKMPGQLGVETKTVLGLVVVHIDSSKKEIWINGPIPGHKNSIVRIKKTGEKKELKLNADLFGGIQKKASVDKKEATVITDQNKALQTSINKETPINEDQEIKDTQEEKTK